MTPLESNFLVPNGTFFLELAALALLVVIVVIVVGVIVWLATRASRRATRRHGQSRR